MLAELRDVHVWIELPDGSHRYPFRSSHEPNYDHDVVLSELADVETIDDIGFIGRTDQGIGVAVIKGLPGAADYDRFMESMGRFREASAWIIDLRANRGGAEPAAARIAGFFNGRRLKYARTQVRSDDDAGGMREVEPRYLNPGDGEPFLKPVVCLTGPGCISSGEGFALMMKAIPHVVLIGQPTRGASGNPRPITLSDGVRVWFSRWVSLELDGTPIEGRGVLPDETVPHQLGSDPAFERAVEWLTEPK